MKRVDVVERSYRNSFHFLLLSCESQMFVKENPDTKNARLPVLNKLHHQFPRRKSNTNIKPDQYFVSQDKNIFVTFGDIVTLVNKSPHSLCLYKGSLNINDYEVLRAFGWCIHIQQEKTFLFFKKKEI